MEITVGTFNLNNLFSRYNFRAEVNIVRDGDIDLDADVSITFAEPVSYFLRQYQGRLVTKKPAGERKTIAVRIRAMNADVLAVQEVEDIGILREFAYNDLAGMYPYQVLVEGNDPRLIDLGVLSRYPIGAVTSWQNAVHPLAQHERVFSRDLLEVEILDVRRRRRLFTVFNNHLKSQYVRWDADAEEGRRAADARRRRQAEVIAEIVAARTRPDSRYIVLGDMNDGPESTTLEPLITSPQLGLVNALGTPTETRHAKLEQPPSKPPRSTAWTHRFKERGKPAVHELFDQIWVSPRLAGRLTGAWIDRRVRHGGDGSDHDPAWIRLDL